MRYSNLFVANIIEYKPVNEINKIVHRESNKLLLITPTFTQVGAICSGSTLLPLPTTSTNGITGTWSPALNTTVTTKYTFTPSPGQLATTTTMTITVNPLPNAGTLSGVTTVCAGTGTTFNSTVSGGVWSSSNTSVATINSSSGVIATLAAGTVTMTYTVTNANGCIKTVTRVLTVKAKPNAGTLSGVNAVCAGTGTTFTSTVAGGVWSSSNTAVATINSSTGVITTLVAGTATMTYSVTNATGCVGTATRVVTVKAKPNAGTLSGVNSVCAGSGTTFTSTVAGGVWSSSNTSVATINSSTGVITTLVAGTATMTYSVTNANGCVGTATRVLTVKAKPNAGTLSGVNSVCAGIGTTFTSTVAGGVWSSSNTAVATINSSTGVITTLVAGTATITYSVTNANGCVGTATRILTVKAKPNAGTLSGVNSVCAGIGTTFTSTVAGGVWSSSNTAVATINSSTGVIATLVAGTATMTYSVTNANGCVGTATRVLTVKAKPNAGTLSGVNSICAGSGTTFTSTVTGGVWSSSNTAVATINSSTGVITTLVAGTATMTYSVTNANGCIRTVTRVLTVNPAPTAGTINGIATLCLDTATISTTTYSSTVQGGVWSSLNPTVASVNSSTGLITSLSLGTATIKYTVTGISPCASTVFATKVITISPVVTPSFTQIAPIEEGTSLSALPALPNVSTNGVAGVWSPLINNNQTTTYTFTPDSGQCASTATMTIEVYPSLFPNTQHVTPGGLLDNVSDNYGNQYTLSDIRINQNDPNGKVLNNTPSICGIFRLHYTAGCGMMDTDPDYLARRAVVCQVFTDISNFLNTPLHTAGNTQKVEIWIRDINPLVTPIYTAYTSQVAGTASAFYVTPSTTYGTLVNNGIIDNEIWKTVHNGIDSYTNSNSPLSAPYSSGRFYHGFVALNFSNPSRIWNLNTSIACPSGMTDIYSVLLHEITHALGFASLINYDGLSKLGVGNNFYSRYDTFLKDANNNFLLSSGGCSPYYNNAFVPSDSVLHPGCTLVPPSINSVSNFTECTTAIHFVGTNNVPVYTQSCFAGGSSISHFEDSCFLDPNSATGSNYPNNSYFTMSETYYTGSTKRFLRPEERNTLCDIGYSVNNQFGGTVFQNDITYGGFTCEGVKVSGVNDGISNNSFSFSGLQGSPIVIPINGTITDEAGNVIQGILNNDVNGVTNNPADIRIECLQDLNDPTARFNTTLTTFSSLSSSVPTINYSTNIPGIHLLRYVPIVNGIRGNITYVYVLVRNLLNFNFCTNYTPDCNLVVNRGFENDYGCGWLGGTYNPFTRNGPYPTNLIPCNFNGNQDTTSLVNNDNYGGFSPQFQILINKLSQNLAPNKPYRLEFDVSLADNASAFNSQIQAYISNTPYKTNPLNHHLLPPLNSQFLLTTNYISDYSSWTHVVLDFTTDGSTDLRYLYLGAITPLTTIPAVAAPLPTCGTNYVDNSYSGYSYYYLDNVSLLEIISNTPSFSITPDTICANATIPNLSSFLVNVPVPLNGVFTVGTSTTPITAFTPTTAGTYTINYSFIDVTGCPTILSDTVTVTDCPQFDPIGPLCQGIDPPLLPEHPSNMPTFTGTWSPTDIDTATVGTSVYTFTPTTGQSTMQTGSVSVTILPTPNAGTLSSTTTTLIAGTSTTITATETGGTWSSSDTAVATVDASGVVTGINAGTAIISYSFTTNGCTAAATVTITVEQLSTTCTATTTWNGTSWSNGIPNTTAFLNTAVVFTADFNTIEDLYACSVLVANNAEVKVMHVGDPLFTTTAHTFTVTNQVVVHTGALFDFEDDASLLQINDVANSGNIKYWRRTPPVNKFDYTYWSSPVAGQSLIGLSPDTLGDKFYWWNPLLPNWVNAVNTSLMEAGKGYIIRGPQGYVDNIFLFDGYFIGAPNNGTLPVQIDLGTSTIYPTYAKTNLIGNPYPSALDIDCFLSDPLNAHLGGAIYLWSHNIPIDWTGTTQQGSPGNAVYNYNVNSYAAYNRLGGVGTGITSIVTTTQSGGSTTVFNSDRSLGKVAAGQGFFIETSASGVATFKNSMRAGSQNQQNSQFYRSNPLPAESSPCVSEERHRLWIQIRNMTPAQQFKQTLIGYSPAATTDITLDRNYDAKTFVAEPYTINLYSLSPANDALTIQGRVVSAPFDVTDVIPLGFTCKFNAAATTNTIEIAVSEFDGLFNTTDFYLRETLIGGGYAYHDIKTTPFTFTINSSTPTADIVNNTTRFAIVFDNPLIPKMAQSINVEEETLFKVSLSPNPFDKGFALHLESPIKESVTVTIYDLVGKIVSSNKFNYEELINYVFGKSLSSGVYQAVITQGDYKEIIKIIKN